MKRKSKMQFLAIAAVPAAIVCMATLRPSNLRAAERNYQLRENLTQLPPGTQWSVMSAVDIDSHGTIYAFKHSEPVEKVCEMSSMVMMIDPHGQFMRT